MSEIFERILVGVSGTEGSRAALALALRMAQLHGARLVLVSVVDTGLAEEIARVLGRSEDEVLAEMEANTRSYLHDGEMRARRLNLPVETVVRRGLPYHEIADEARASRADLVVLGSGPPGGVHGAALGRVVERVVEHVDCPVLVVRHRRGRVGFGGT